MAFFGCLNVTFLGISSTTDSTTASKSTLKQNDYELASLADNNGKTTPLPEKKALFEDDAGMSIMHAEFYVPKKSLHPSWRALAASWGVLSRVGQYFNNIVKTAIIATAIIVSHDFGLAIMSHYVF